MPTICPARPISRRKTGAKIGIGEHIREVQRIFRPVFDATDLKTDGSDFDHLFKDGERFKIGDVGCRGAARRPVIRRPTSPTGSATPPSSATPCSCPTTARRAPIFPVVMRAQLYRSIRELLSLPAATRLFMCHDYKAPGRDLFAWETTVAEERENNVHVKDGVSEDAFVAMREARDATLSAPRLLLPSIQVNIRAGKLPPAHINGVSYLTIPVKFKNAAAALS